MIHRRQVRQLITAVVVLMFTTGFTFPVMPCYFVGPSIMPHPIESDEFLRRQAAALLPVFRDDVEPYAYLPRYQIEARLDLERGEVHGQLVCGYHNRSGDEISELVFRLYPNASTIYGGGSLSIEGITRDGNAIEFQRGTDPTVLRVPLSPPAAPCQTATVSISFTSRVPTSGEQGYEIFYRGTDVITLAAWHPVLTIYENGWHVPPVPAVGDAILTEPSLYEVKFTIPEGYAPVCTGTVIGESHSGEGVEWHIVSGPVRGFTLAISDRFELYRTRVDGVMVNFYALGAATGNMSPETALKMAADAFQVFVEKFGPYPFSLFNVVETSVSIGGYEFVSMVVVEQRLRLRGSLAYYRFIVAHEAAHQWWYGLTGNNQVAEPWLDESLATYSVVLYLEESEGQASGDALVSRFRREHGPPSRSSIAIDSPATRFLSWETYRVPAYYHGALFLDLLRDEMGDEAFFRLLRIYHARYKYQIASTEDFLEVAENVAGRSLGSLTRPLFERAQAATVGGEAQ